MAFIDFPEGWCEPGKVWEAREVSYGMRQAAHAWEQDYSSRMEEFGMRKGRFTPTVFYGVEKAHGGDFVFLG